MHDGQELADCMLDLWTIRSFKLRHMREHEQTNQSESQGTKHILNNEGRHLETQKIHDDIV